MNYKCKTVLPDRGFPAKKGLRRLRAQACTDRIRALTDQVFLHMAGDAGVSRSSPPTIWTASLWLDPIVSLAIALAVLRSGRGLGRDSVQ